MRFLLTVGLLVIWGGLSGCQRPPVSLLAAPPGWRVYQNPRYGFEFAYPPNWQPAPPPGNVDGRRFVHPQIPEVTMVGWATQVTPKPDPTPNPTFFPDPPADFDPQTPPNFVTEQGVAGVLQVEIGPEVSTMTLTLDQSPMRYHWRGQAPREHFAENYDIFERIARGYRIPR